MRREESREELLEGPMRMEERAAEKRPASELVRETRRVGGVVHIRATEFSTLAVRRQPARNCAASIWASRRLGA